MVTTKQAAAEKEDNSVRLKLIDILKILLKKEDSKPGIVNFLTNGKECNINTQILNPSWRRKMPGYTGYARLCQDARLCLH